MECARDLEREALQVRAIIVRVQVQVYMGLQLILSKFSVSVICSGQNNGWDNAALGYRDYSVVVNLLDLMDLKSEHDEEEPGKLHGAKY